MACASKMFDSHKFTWYSPFLFLNLLKHLRVKFSSSLLLWLVTPTFIAIY